MPDYYTPAEIAEKFNVKLRTVQNWIRSGQIRAHKVGGMWRIKKTNCEEFERNFPTNEPKEK